MQTSMIPPLVEPKVQQIGDFGYKLKDTWADYNLHTYDMSFNGVATNTQAIFYQGRFVRFAGKHYHVFPNESLLSVIDPIMEQFKARRVGGPEKGGFELVYGKNKSAKFESNYVYQQGEKKYVGTKIRANYVFDKFDVTGNGDVVEFGVTLANSIGGDMSLQISPYSLRQVCTNGMMHTASVMEISDSVLQNVVKKNPELDQTLIADQVKEMLDTSRNFEDLMQELKKSKMIHNKEIPVNWITSRILMVRESITDLKKQYREMTNLDLTQIEAEKLARNMPKRLTEKMEWLNIKEVIEETAGVKTMKQEVEIVGNPTKWEAFNDHTR
jgi:hypothetical protein